VENKKQRKNAIVNVCTDRTNGGPKDSLLSKHFEKVLAQLLKRDNKLSNSD
jgi:hypothetical protein